ncbi:Gfo/Idh/MocA family protein [Ruminococcus gauvreauii]|uniref:Gfo/Idh/MocA family oxidoreductase n=1 Tax=Ruminococcus gauvreauii TaxID=438033 RepID=A0ABY5VDE6_9FIRM|nr:Gfo/Idh/MocA family oxidoreductase [Ruminococcus gauvreauii]UWP58604.1 Gfo/Idh/MocA family oxidoreductase [Ruminococcus gauvreauii]
MFNEEFHLKRPLNWAMVGGGRGSQIGYIHRCSAARDRLFTLTAGAFDVDQERGREFGVNLGVPPERCYADYQTMFAGEAERPDGIEAVTIATPNGTHYEICRAALNAGLHAVCEKPLCFTSEQADELLALAEEKNRIVGVTYGYTGAQMIHQAKNMIARGDLGDIRIINMQFAHGFHSAEVEKNDAGTKWRVNPATAGPSYVLGDVGTHALYLAKAMIPSLEIEELMCNRQSFVKSRAPLEDNAFVLLHFKGGAVGNLWASCVNAGSVHQQKIRVVGSKASVEWWDEHPNQLRYEVQGQPAQILDRGMGYLYQDDEMITQDRMGGGHAEGLFEAWANLYRRFGTAMDRVNRGQRASDVMDDMWFPNIRDGAQGVKFIETCVCSADHGSTWVKY